MTRELARGAFPLDFTCFTSLTINTTFAIVAAYPFWNDYIVLLHGPRQIPVYEQHFQYPMNPHHPVLRET